MTMLIGSGQHAAYFADNIAAFGTIQPTEYDPGMLPVIAAVTQRHVKEGRVLPPLRLDVTNTCEWTAAALAAADSPLPTLPSGHMCDVILCTNLCHISPWETTIGLMTGVAACLKPGGRFFLYGPFLRNNRFTTESNERFDSWLRQKDARFGYRDVDAVASIAPQLILQRVVDMPENNFTLVFEKL